MSERPERPILFSGEMVRAILAGRKTQTRRVVTRGTSVCGSASLADLDLGGAEPVGDRLRVPGPHETYHRVFARWEAGDRLWVREAFRLRADQDDKPPRDDWWKSGAWYEADGLSAQPSGCAGGAGRLRPSIHMPRWASRILLDVVAVRAERLHEITDEDALAEGCTDYALDGDGYALGQAPRDAFQRLWRSINDQRPGCAWDDNPWVWVIEFRWPGLKRV